MTVPVDFWVAAATRLVPRETWMTLARCAGSDPDDWFSYDSAVTEKAAETCRGCPVRLDCGTYGMDEPWGLWGGLTPDERQRLRGLRPFPTRSLNDYIRTA